MANRMTRRAEGLAGALLGLTLLPAAAMAQTAGAPDTLIVLDASNSMWGQINGVAKIEIARDALGSLVDGLPDGGQTGLMVYGHRRVGDCSDVEMVSAMSPLDRDGLKGAAQRLKPKGKTPITEALRQAAKSLSIADKPSRLILVSDGIETCSGDPCALAEELARSGIDFKAHVIGFDIASRADQAKIACIASLTGGTYTNASNAEELADALRKSAEAVAEPAKEAKLPELALIAIDGATGKPVDGPVSWTISGRDSEAVVASGFVGGSVSVPLEPGAYVVTANLGEKTGGAEAEVLDTGGSAQVVLDGEIPKASVTPASASAPASSMLSVAFEGPNDPNDYLRIQLPGGGRMETDIWSSVSDANPAMMRLPSEPGDYEIAYVWGSGDGRVLAQVALKVTPAEMALELPPSVAAGTFFEVTWKGPGGDGDFIGIVPVGGGAGDYAGRFSYVSDDPVRLQAPSEPGQYEAAYITGNDNTVLIRKAFEVVKGESGLTAAASAEAGGVLEVRWEGPGGPSDWVGVSETGSPADAYLTYATPSEPVLRLALPLNAGSYELRYVLSTREGQKILSAQPLTLTEPDIVLGVAPEVEAGSEVTITAKGPANGSSWIGFSKVGAEQGDYISGAWSGIENITDGKMTLMAPEEPGAYELRFVLSGTGDPRVAKAVPVTIR